MKAEARCKTGSSVNYESAVSESAITMMKFDRLTLCERTHMWVKKEITTKHTLKLQIKDKPKWIDIEIGYGSEAIYVILHESRLFSMSVGEFMSVNITFSMWEFYEPITE